jgi:hypothetical protein
MPRRLRAIPPRDTDRVRRGRLDTDMRHRPAPAGSSIRYPNFSIDASLELHKIE